MIDNYLWYNDIPTNKHITSVCSGTFLTGTGYQLSLAQDKLGDQKDSVNMNQYYFDSEKAFHNYNTKEQKNGI